MSRAPCVTSSAAGAGLPIRVLALWLLLVSGQVHAQAPDRGIPQYRAVQERLATGWNTWDSRSVLRYVLLPEGFALNLALKQHYWLDEKYLPTALIGRWQEGAERIRPGARTYDGSYSELEISWETLQARVQTASDGDDLVVLVTPLATPASRVKLVVEAVVLWNRPGALAREGEILTAEFPQRLVRVFATAPHVEDPYVASKTPYLALELSEPVGLSSGRPRTLAEIQDIIAERREALQQDANRYGELAEALLAVQAGVAWNLIYEPRHDRVVSTVGRLWNEEYGGYALFGWDNFFLAYITSLSSRDLAYANVVEHLHGLTDGGFIPNDNRGNGSKSWDRSQPPVGGIMVREVYRRHPEQWFLEATFDALLSWNRWWPTRRLNEGLLSYGSHEAENPFNEPAVRTKRTAGYESGMDDSPMYEDVPFNPEKNTLELQDVGLNSLYIADCRALAELAHALGREQVRGELLARADSFAERMESLWDDDAGYYYNRRTDLGTLSHRRSPTLFYPMLARVPSPERADRMVREHLLNPGEFWGEHVLPSTTRDDSSFARQRYWKGAIWPPLNFLTYLSLRNYGMEDVRRALAERSLQMFLTEWRRQGYVSENYSSITGTGDDERLSSDPFHSWGALFGFMAFIEAGVLAPPEEGL